MAFDMNLNHVEIPNEYLMAANDPGTPKLCAAAMQRAMNFILEFGTNLQRERLLYHFPEGARPVSSSNVLAALAHYQNEDGGFGHGLEADLRSKQSTVIATTVGLQILSSIDAIRSPMADRALEYLSANYTDEGWQAIHAGANDAPHAPWWKYKVPCGYAANPTVEVLKYLLDRRAMASATPELMDRAITHISEHALDMHELLCYSRLFESAMLSKEQRLALLPHLLSNAFQLVNSDPNDWEEYCLTPLCLAQQPGSVFAEFFADVIPENFEFLVNSQNEDGSWSPAWSWAGEFPATWKVVATELKAEVTLKNLLRFQAFDAIAP